ncbi:outer membrane receptor for ferrienterochelin and colicins [Chryseobacterium defluvii]|uniref:Outer membrane receptor for ferrienterochelin and colicins n=1 Tax=Chryseobacterium defluvii TaxID=160396 RepID=A0A840K9I1_9FLAO|nr:TonB-dependent receptor plug domain-containing protein [Chryseobacterium defluvii]MBB4805075.1 outer membrane receptor for ferrienterochelin and colicins [Chryseobacterium defluvii]
MKKKVLSVLLLSTIIWINAQEKDSLDQKKIEEVVITGQFTQQSINKSIYRVEVIDAQQIKNMAVTNVAEVLNQNLNILIEPNKGSGDSNASIMGLSGEYTKILIDNIPVVSDQGMGNLVDLTKINVNNIERIEVVKGAMGVEYGNNALAGVINIITKKNYRKKFTAQASVQEETVNKDYDWFKKGNGRHIQFLNLGYRINDHWSVSADINHNDFQGYKGRLQGYKHFSENNDGLRGYDWQPKDQLTTNGIIRYSKNNTSFFYKANFLTEKVNYYNPLVEELYLGGGNRTYIANDRDYSTKRWIHQFNIQTKLGQRINYSGDFSYQTQERKYEDYQYDVPNRQEVSRAAEQLYYKSDVLYSRGMFSNFLNSDKINFQIGYELDRTKGFASSRTGLFGGNDLERSIFSYANFLSAEWNVTDWLSFRPGVRMALSDKFDSQYNYSTTTRFKISQKSDLRLVFGTANRFPAYEELYAYMVDNNHDIQGNENLKPETGYSTGVFWDYNTTSSGSWKFNFSFSGMYLDVNDRIESVIISNSPLKFTYLNVDNYKSILFGGGLNIRKGDLAVNAGVSVMGISQVLNTGNIYSPDDFNYYAEANLAANYTLPSKTLFALYYKYTGKQKRYTHRSNAQDPMDRGEYVLGEIGDFNMLNFTVSQPFFNNHLELSLGIKNIFDVTTVKNTIVAGDGHNAAAGEQNLFYGRSYFARLNYNF